MIDPSLAVQIAIRSRLTSAPEVTALVPANSIFDRNQRPERFPCVIIGDGQTVIDEITYSRQHVTCYCDLHIWTDSGDLQSAKLIAGPIRAALSNFKPDLTPHRCIDFRIQTVRFVRDPGLQHSHAVINIESLIEVIQ